MHSIPIFPLNLVVFPGSKYPLHIFEERYKILIQKCLQENTGFGIVAAFDKKISDMGVYVLIDSVLKYYDNGESDIV
ncbi:MAG TPA: LON peptidase substrate-binding domain-containing protein, partial [Ignavibacteriaceae bacterium]|nr:LON peptidase substrate-binding domain-containing protein [Ignavibacteriaceae bacterium]